MARLENFASPLKKEKQVGSIYSGGVTAAYLHLSNLLCVTQQIHNKKIGKSLATKK